MANNEQINELLGGGGQGWNKWRQTNPDVKPDLSGANLSAQNFSRSAAARSSMMRLPISARTAVGADFRDANLKGADLSGQNLTGANLARADLTGAVLTGTLFLQADVTNAIFNDCKVYGVSTWGLIGEPAEQKNLIITPDDEATLTVDRLDVSQFIYLLLTNNGLRHTIETITSKAVLILGRFVPERKEVLDRLRSDLRARDYLPMMFDFEKPSSRNTQETVTTLARLAKFVVADITDPSSVPQELIDIVKSLPSVPVQPILLSGRAAWGMFESVEDYPWVFPILEYESSDDITAKLPDICEKADQYIVGKKNSKPTS